MHVLYTINFIVAGFNLFRQYRWKNKGMHQSSQLLQQLWFRPIVKVHLNNGIQVNEQFGFGLTDQYLSAKCCLGYHYSDGPSWLDESERNSHYSPWLTQASTLSLCILLSIIRVFTTSSLWIFDLALRFPVKIENCTLMLLLLSRLMIILSFSSLDTPIGSSRIHRYSNRNKPASQTLFIGLLQLTFHLACSQSLCLLWTVLIRLQ